MAGPRVHVEATGLLLVAYVVGFIISLSFDWLDVLWILIFGVLIDVDHIPFGRLGMAFRFGGLAGVKKSWLEYGWFDADHLNVMHTWTALIATIFFSYEISNPWPSTAFIVHMMIDAGSLDQNDYPKCSPMPGTILRHFAVKYYPEWALYRTKGLPH